MFAYKCKWNKYPLVTTKYDGGERINADENEQDRSDMVMLGPILLKSFNYNFKWF